MKFLKKKSNRNAVYIGIFTLFINLLFPKIINHFLNLFGLQQYEEDYIKVVTLGISIVFINIYFISKALIKPKNKNQSKSANKIKDTQNLSQN